MAGGGDVPRPHIVHHERPRLAAAATNTDSIGDYLAGFLAAQDDSRTDS